MLAISNSKAFKYFVELFLAGGDSSVSVGAARQFTQSIVGSVPIPRAFNEHHNELGALARRIWATFAEADSIVETSRFFAAPVHESWRDGEALLQIVQEEEKNKDFRHLKILDLTCSMEEAVADLYELDVEARNEITNVCGLHPNQYEAGDFLKLPENVQKKVLAKPTERIIASLRKQGNVPRSITKMCFVADRFLEVIAAAYSTRPDLIIQQKQRYGISESSHAPERMTDILSYFLGCCLGRWDIRYVTGERQPPELPDPFDPLPICPPGMLQNAEGLPAEPKDVPADYPLRISRPGILVDDETHPEDIVARVREAIEVIWKDRADAIEQEACEILGVKTLRDYFRRPAVFFADHLKRYGKSRRKAPIYWPLSTKSGSYTLWLYYHRLNDQTLYICVNDFVEPKLHVAD